MAETAAHLVDNVIPDVPVRQWVLSLPIPLRYLLASHPEMMGPVLEVVNRAISSFLINKAGLTRREAKTGAVTLIQRFGSAAGNLNIHFHSLVIDGIYRLRGGKPVFEYVAAPSTEEMARLVERIAKRVMKLLTRRGYLIEEEGVTYLEAGEGEESLGPLHAAACNYRIALGPRRGRKVWSIKMAEAQEDSIRCVQFNGFSLHSDVRCGKGERKKLERLCRYVTRPAISNERLTLTDCDQVVYELKTPYRDGTTHIVMSPLELLQRLAALVPRPRLNLIRFHGVLAPNAAWRSDIVPEPPAQDEEGAEPMEEGRGPSGRYISWARLLKRVFDIDVTTCPNCGGQLKMIAAIEDPPVIQKILTHLGLPPHPPPRSPARYDVLSEAEIY